LPSGLLRDQAMLKLSKAYNERVKEEEGKTAEELIVANVRTEHLTWVLWSPRHKISVFCSMPPHSCCLTFLLVILSQVGKIDPKRHLENDVADLMASNITQCLGAMLDTIVF
jgi:26S proteasome regulatory subunit N11